MTGSPWVRQRRVPTSQEPSLHPWGRAVFPVEVLGHSLDHSEGVVQVQPHTQSFPSGLNI